MAGWAGALSSIKANIGGDLVVRGADNPLHPMYST